ncbi:MAG: recombinase family protein [Dermatophilaceae bacterium]
MNEQSPDLQVQALRAAGAEAVYVDHATGATMDRPQLAAALTTLRSGDVFCVWRRASDAHFPTLSIKWPILSVAAWSSEDRHNRGPRF